MTPDPVPSLQFSFADAERAQLMAWVGLSAGVKIDFFEEMVELAWRSGALAPERLALRDSPIRPLSHDRS
ncbi:hypothetical protein [Luteimonas changyuni]|uniref:hypothetical protein n=1 Tax=Luteimonas sp. MJ145 TaxID=3129234 RepID=UPI0031BAF8AF